MNRSEAMQYPPQTGAYIVKTDNCRSTGRWQDFRVARVPICLGKEFYEGDMLKATIDWCAARFDHVQIFVSDTLQRHNICFDKNLDDQAALAAARREGDAWIARNLKAIRTLPSYTISRWDDWMEMPGFPAVHKQVVEAYSTIADFRASIDDSVTNTWLRKHAALGPDSLSRKERFKELSLRYILEELAVFSMRSESLRAIDVHPGMDFPITTKYQGNVPEGLPPGMGKRYLCRIRLSVNKDMLVEQDNEPAVQGQETEAA